MSEPYSKKLFYKVFKDMLTEEHLKNIATQKTISQWFEDITKEIKSKKVKEEILRRISNKRKNISTSRDS